MTSSPITLWQMNGEKGETVTDFIFLGSKITMDIDCSHEMADKGPYSQRYGFSISHVQMWELDHKEVWVWKKWCFQIVVLEKTLESPLDSKEIKPVDPKGNQPWISIGRTVAEVEAPILCHLMWRADSLEKTLMMVKIEGKRRRGWQRIRWLDSTIDSMDMNLSKLQVIVEDEEPGRSSAVPVCGVAESDMT